jgi:hypothetical protein
LNEFIYKSPLYQERGFRHVQNVFGSIFDEYDDLLKKQLRNKKLRDAPMHRAKTHGAYREREPRGGLGTVAEGAERDTVMIRVVMVKSARSTVSQIGADATA